MKVTVLPLLIGALVTVTKELIKGFDDLKISGQVETIHFTALLRSARVLEIWVHFFFIQTPVINYPQTLMWKTLKRVK